jgi:urease accessory protein UreF
MKSAEKNARLEAMDPDLARSEAACLRGEFHALLRQVGSPGIAPDAPAPFWAADMAAPPALGRFLEDYLAGLLLPRELPAIVAAHGHAQRGELRELLALDQHLAASLLPTPFAAPSRWMGRLQLARLRPLRDNRLLQRYLAAMESGQAYGWHTLVYGVTLALYSLPLRQGLLHYFQETLSTLASAAGRSIKPGDWKRDEMLSPLLARAPQAVEAALAGEGDPFNKLDKSTFAIRGG